MIENRFGDFEIDGVGHGVTKRKHQITCFQLAVCTFKHYYLCNLENKYLYIWNYNYLFFFKSPSVSELLFCQSFDIPKFQTETNKMILFISQH